jgi:hypothetical protein
MKNFTFFLLTFIFSIAAMMLNFRALAGGGPCYDLTESVSVCNGQDYTFPDGTVQTITTQVVHTSHLQTVVTQCDSIIETTVSVLPTYNRTKSFFDICTGIDYTFPDGTVQTILAHTEHTSNLQTAGFQCDSIILTILNTTDIDASVSLSGNVITANQTNAGYQWVDCNNGFAPVSGGGNQSYVAPDGNFAVIIYKGGCTDTSACQQIGTVGLDDLNRNNVSIYPNPSSGMFTVNLGSTNREVNYTIRNAIGQRIQSQTFYNVSSFNTYIVAAVGFYYLDIQGSDGLNITYRMIKE